MLKSDKLYISRYNDFYGSLLTEHQSEIIRLYYDCDISLFEIAEQFGVSRQAIRDTIKRAEQLLIGYEEKLGLSKRFAEISKCVGAIEDAFCSDDKRLGLEQIALLKGILEDNDGDI